MPLFLSLVSIDVFFELQQKDRLGPDINLEAFALGSRKLLRFPTTSTNDDSVLLILVESLIFVLDLWDADKRN